MTYTTHIADGKKYLTATYRGTEYTLMRNGDGWGVASRRLSLGRFNLGGFKCYRTFDDVAKGCKAFASLDIATAL